MQWETVVARRVEKILRGMNGGTWPVSAGEWEAVARRLDAKIHYIPNLPVERSRWMDDTICVPALPRQSPLLLAILLHEMAEIATCYEGTEPYNYPPDSYPHSQAARHAIALQVGNSGRRGVGNER